MGKWLIIVGYEDMGNWVNCRRQCTRRSVQGTNVSISDTISFTERGYAIVLLNTSGRVISEFYVRIFADIGIDISDEIVVFCHEYKDHNGKYGSVASDLQDLKPRYKNLGFRLFFGAAPNEERNYPFWVITQVNDILKLSNGPQQLQNWTEIPFWDELIDVIKPISFKHTIACLFLPFHIDFQALQEITDESKGKEYAEEIIEEYKNRQNDKNKGFPFLQLLADLQFLVARIEGIALNNGTLVLKSLSNKDLPKGKCLKELVEEAGLQDNQLKEFCKSLGFNENTWKPNSDVVKFFEALDGAINTNSPSEFLEAMKENINNKDFNQWFIQWFTKLEELLYLLE